MKNKIFENLKFIVGIVTILLIVVFQKSLSTVAIIGGVGLALYGVCAFLSNDKLGYVFTGMGISLVSAVSLFKLDVLPKFESITFFFCLSMALIVILAFIFEKYSDKEHKRIHSLEIDAEVIDLVKNPNTKKEYYQPIYEYYIDNESYAVPLPGYIDKGIPSIGEKIKLYVNPDDVTDVYFEKRKSDKLYLMTVGLFLLVASIGIIISLFV